MFSSAFLAFRNSKLKHCPGKRMLTFISIPKLIGEALTCLVQGKSSLPPHPLQKKSSPDHLSYEWMRRHFIVHKTIAGGH